ncbi:MAG: SH3 domain-containing protein [Candidatus Riflebacteria bacterium]|nr:SH3 domain-containing protein [Candidatus Riflebacteria bacterium]
MKKIKILLVLIIFLSIIVLGLFMGKQVLSSLENGSIQQAALTASATKVAPSDNTANAEVPSIADLPNRFENQIKPGSNQVKAEVQIASNPNVFPGVSDKSWYPATGTKFVAYIADKGVNVRDGPSLQSKQIFRLMQGTRGMVLERKSGWTKVKWDFNRKIAWVRDDLITQGPFEVMLGIMGSDGKGVATATQESIKAAAVKAAKMAESISVAIAKPAPASETVRGFSSGNLPKEAVIIAEPFAKIRSMPSTKAERVGKVAKGMAVSIKSVQQVGTYQWFEISYSNGKKSGWTREDNLKF